MDTSSRPAPPVPPAEGTAWVQPPHLPRRGSPGTTGHGNQQLAPLPPCVPHPGHPAPRAALTAPQNCALRRNATAPELLALPPEPAGALQLGKGSLQRKSISISPFFSFRGHVWEGGAVIKATRALGQLGEVQGSGGARWKRSCGSWQQRHGPGPVGRICPYQTGFVPTAGTWHIFAHLVPWFPQKNGDTQPPSPRSTPGFGVLWGVLWGVPWPGLCSVSPLPPPDFLVLWAGQKCLLQALCVELRTGKLAPVGVGPALHHACHFSCTALMPNKRLCLPAYGKINPSRP